ncbi:uncharacterized protein [Haliotis cracherodii]|uniref:uncharacterized protein n=1 Tax=Haliotis cracherodii TaxID=6455 RepID=UPI0039E7F808
MSTEALFEPRVNFGQGKSATTLLTEDGCYFPIVAHGSYRERQQVLSAPFKRGWGARPMHATTLLMAKAPWVPDYTTTSKQFHGGSKTLNPPARATPGPSMHISQYHLGVPHPDNPWRTNYSQDFTAKQSPSANHHHVNTHAKSREHTSGSEVKAVIRASDDPPSYWSQYNRIHSKLGHILGPGVPREYPVRKQYNFITGTMGSPAWKEDNRRVSGNRVLRSARTKVQNTSIIS